MRISALLSAAPSGIEHRLTYFAGTGECGITPGQTAAAPEGHLWLLPRTIPHPGFKRPPGYPPNPVQQLREPVRRLGSFFDQVRGRAQVPQDRSPRPQRRGVAVLPAPSDRDAAAPALGGRPHFFGQARLADPGRPVDHGELHVAGLGVAEHPDELLHLRRPADERRPARRAHRSRGASASAHRCAVFRHSRVTPKG